MQSRRRHSRISRPLNLRRRPTRRRVAGGESLEARRVLTGNVAGSVYEDLDSDNVVDLGEGLSGWTVFADTNNNGTRDGNEPQATTGWLGNYHLGGLAAGLVVVRTIAPGGWQATDVSRTATVTSNATVSNVNLRGSLTIGAVVTGSIWNDGNGNGSRDPGEVLNSSVTVYADLDNDSIRDAGEPWASTFSSNGNATLTYKLALPLAGTYTIRQQLGSPWQQVSPVPGEGHSITVTAGGRAAAPDFVARNPIVTIGGSIYEDANGNFLRDSLETGLGGWRVYADLNDNGELDSTEPSATTNSFGNYSLAINTAGSLPSVVLRTIAPVAGWSSTVGGDQRTISGLIGGLQHQAIFGYRTLGGLVSGMVWNDVNANGSREGSEGPLAGRTVYADLDGDGALGVDEPRTTTLSDGAYQLLLLTAGTFPVRQLLPTGWLQTAPAAEAGQPVTIALGTGGGAATPGSRITGRNFGARGTTFAVSGAVYNDADANGSRGSAETALVGWRVYADLNNNGIFEPTEPAGITSSSGTYTVSIPSITTSTTVRLRLEVQADSLATAPQGGQLTLTAVPGGTGTANFGARLLGRAITGTLWNDADGNGARDAGETVIGGWTVFVDANTNGVLDSGEIRAVSGADGNYVLQLSAAGDYTVRVLRSTTWLATAPNEGFRTVTIDSSPVTGTNFGFRSTVATVSGNVFDDVNQNGGQDLGESGLVGWRVFADLDDDGILDSGEPSTTTTSNGAYNLSIVAGASSLATKVRVLPAAGWLVTAPVGGAQALTLSGGQAVVGRSFAVRPAGTLVSGMAWVDADADGVVDAGESTFSGWTVFADADNDSILDANEPRTTTGTGGIYQLVITTAGAYTVRIAGDSGFLTSSPAGGGHAVTVGEPERISGRNFGRQPTTGFVSGTVFHDTDGSGAINSGEAGLAGWRVFVDLNGNGLLDNNEPSSLSSSSGGFSLGTNLTGPSLATTLRVQPQVGWVGTLPTSTARPVTLLRGQTVAAQHLGFRADLSVAVVSGALFNDANANGLRDSNDFTVGGRTVYADLNNDGSMNTDEPRTTTAADGSYRLAFGTAGTFVLRQVVPTGFAQTTPTENGGISVTLTLGGRLTDRNFGSRSIVGAVAGMVFSDANSNGIQDGGEAGLSGWRVYADLNGNDAWDSSEPSAITSFSGSYGLNGLLASATAYAIRTVVPNGWVATAPTGGEQAVVVSAGTTVSGRNFGNRSTSSVITGALWSDVDADGVRDSGELPLAGRTVFVDTDADGILDGDEPRASTGSDGTYRLSVPTTGVYLVRQLLPGGWLATSPAGNAGRTVTITATNETASGNDFGSRPSQAQIMGFVFADADTDGVVDAGEGVANVRVYADLDDDDTHDSTEPSFITSATGAYSLNVSTIDPADSAALSRTIAVRLVLPGGYTTANPVSGEQAVPVTGGQTVAGRNFAVTLAGAAVTGLIWNDGDASGIRGPSEAALGNMTVFADANGNGTLDSSEARTPTAADGTYRLIIPTAGSFTIRVVASTAWIPTLPVPAGHAVTVEGGETLSGRNFGLRAAFATIAGAVYDDADQSGTRGSGEGGVAAVRIYADLDDDGVLDPGEPATATSSNGSYALQIPVSDSPIRVVTLRAIASAGWAALAPVDGVRPDLSVTGGTQTGGQDFGFRLSSALVTGSVWNDANGNGSREPGDAALSGRTVFVDLDGDSVLDANEPRATTAFDGTYQLLLGEVGSYTIRHVLPAFWTQTSPAAGHVVTVEALGRRVTARDFGTRNTAANVSGSVFDDLDGDGIRDPGEAAVAAVRIYADSNDDGLFTVGEPSVLSSASGSFFLTVPNLTAATTVRIRQEVTTGWRVASPATGAHQIQLTGGQNVSGLAFANRLTGGLVSGVIWNDLDNDGTRDQGEPALAGRTVYVDANDNAVLDASEARAISAGDGSYQLLVTAEGEARIRTLLPAGWVQTRPTGGAAVLAVTLGGRYTAQDFGTRLTAGAVSGTVVNDLPVAGASATSAAPLAGWIVYVDSNDDGILDDDEVRTTTTANGSYTISGIGEGSVRLRLLLQAGWVFSSPADGLLQTEVVAGKTTTGRQFSVRPIPPQA
jgi:serine-aspartate repeat-containing protein C/D/E